MLSYVGGLHLDRWKPLSVLAKCLFDQNATLRIFAPAQDVVMFKIKFSGLGRIEFGSLAAEDVMPSLKESDILVHVESFGKSESVYTKYSVSTKLAQYFASGKPVLGIGPAGIASLKLIEEAQAGIVISSEDPQVLGNTLSRFARDVMFRSRCGQNGLQYAKRHFYKSAVCPRFLNTLRLGIGGGKSLRPAP